MNSTLLSLFNYRVDPLTGEILDTPSFVAPDPQDQKANASSPYKDSSAKSQQIQTSSWFKGFKASLSPEGLAVGTGKDDDSPDNSYPACAKWALPGKCEHGHEIAKLLLCGKEWCPVCGEKDSFYHRRRVARLLPRAGQMKSMGYFDIEFPIASRGNYRSRKSWSKFRSTVTRSLKRHGITRGLSRWHWFGSCRHSSKKGYCACMSKRCDGDDVACSRYQNRGWNPHLNVLIDGGYLNRAELERVKADLRLSTKEPKLIVHYSFAHEVPQMWNSLKYVTRATFRRESWDYAMARELHGFRNQSWFGTWKGEQLWGLKDTEAPESIEVGAVSKLESGCCHCCGTPITWSKPIPTTLVMAAGGKHIGGGYFEIPCRGDPPEPIGFEPVEFCHSRVDEGEWVWVDVKKCFESYFRGNGTPREWREYPDIRGYMGRKCYQSGFGLGQV